MKKYLNLLMLAILLAVLGFTSWYCWGFYLDWPKETPVTAIATTEGSTIILMDKGGQQPFEVRGVDIGTGIPGHFAAEYAIDKETYLRWFKLIQEMGANTIRVYTILSADFYDAFYEYNQDNAQPLYLLHGVRISDYIQNSHADAYDDEFFKDFAENCRSVVDVIHGRKLLIAKETAEHSNGFYTKDISPWVLGYIIGVDWEDVTVVYTDQMQKEKSSYQGTYLYTLPEATPFEAMLAEVGDTMIQYEGEKYKTQKLLAFSNWPMTDPFEYPYQIDELFFKSAKVDAEHIKATDALLSGQFASYHVYPYYPDYLSYYDSWKTELFFAEKHQIGLNQYNTYGTYLEMLVRHHSIPVVISEFGIPTSRGRAQPDINTGRAQGYMSEAEQGQALVQSYQDIIRAGCAGGIIFSWQDEWFKQSWNTMANVDLSGTAYWSDAQTSEQFFGLLSFEPGETESICYVDGDVSEWQDKDVVAAGDGYSLSMKYDEKFLYFRIHQDGLAFEQQQLYLPIDITGKSGSYYADGYDVKFDRPADFLIILDGRENSRVLVQERYDAFMAVYSASYTNKNNYFKQPDKDSAEFFPIYQALQINQIRNKDGVMKFKRKFETGKLTYGNGNPAAADFNSLADFICVGDEIELRLPYQLLNFSNPSKMEVHDDYYQHYGIEALKIKELYVGVGSSEAPGERIELFRFPLAGWNKNVTYHERLKQSYYYMQKLWEGETKK